jgi:SAM-dependent methyltransferase
MTTTTPSIEPTIQEQASVVLAHAAGYASHRTVAIGLRSGLLGALAASEHATPDELAERLGLDPFYVSVWCRSAFSAGICDRDAGSYRLDAHMATLLLDADSPTYAGACSSSWSSPRCSAASRPTSPRASGSGGTRPAPTGSPGSPAPAPPFYTRLVPGGLQKVPGLPERLAAGATVVDSACGAGVGLVRLAAHYPACQIVGVDGDGHSIEQARKRIAEAGLADRVTLVCSPLEELRLEAPAALVINNISMHECRDIDQVTERVRASLEPGGWFVISDFPFPDTEQGLRSVPGRIMGAIQFFEAQIDDQLLTRAAYDHLLSRHGFTELGSFSLTPMHAVTHGRKPR